MRNKPTQQDMSHGEGRAGLRRVAALAFVVAGLVPLSAACSGGSTGPKVASLGSTVPTTASGSSSGSARPSGALAYSECMRANGITDFPDPNSSGGIGINGTGIGGDLDPNSPKNQAAQKACQSLAAGANGTPAQQAQDYAAGLKYAACVRSHGIAGFPDPQPPGSGPATASSSSGSPGGGSNGVDPNSQQFMAADKACKHYIANVSGGEPSVNSSGAGGS